MNKCTKAASKNNLYGVKSAEQQGMLLNNRCIIKFGYKDMMFSYFPLLQ